MRRVIVMIALVICVFSIKAQTINVNPDPNGEPWWTGPDPVITTEVQARIDAIQDMELTDESINTQLNSVVDNSTNLYFRPVFNQMGASCAQAAGIGYTFTYELNRIRNTSAQVAQNQYAPFYTYNYLWEVFGDGSWTTDGWQIAKENGCASVETWGGMHVDMQKWMSGYSNYKNSMNNTLDKYEKINVRYDYQGYTPLTRMKHWLNDHNEGSATGGLIVIYAWLGNAYYATPVGGNDNVPIMLGLSTPAAGFFML